MTDVSLRCKQCRGEDLLFLTGQEKVAVLCRNCWHTEHEKLTPELKIAIQKKMSPVDPFKEQ